LKIIVFFTITTLVQPILENRLYNIIKWTVPITATGLPGVQPRANGRRQTREVGKLDP